MKAYQHELAHLYEHRKKVLDFGSASLFQFLLTASAIGVVVAFIGIGLTWFGGRENLHGMSAQPPQQPWKQ
jgi:hypothetical protein